MDTEMAAVLWHWKLPLAQLSKQEWSALKFKTMQMKDTNRKKDPYVLHILETGRKNA